MAFLTPRSHALLWRGDVRGAWAAEGGLARGGVVRMDGTEAPWEEGVARSSPACLCMGGMGALDSARVGRAWRDGKSKGVCLGA